MAPSAVDEAIKGFQLERIFDFFYHLLFPAAPLEVNWATQGLEPAQQELLLVESDESSSSSSSSSCGF
jgi:hypothetical protein